ncbi:MAG: septum formation initiator family protein [SAR324 cluster bacterium]|nr:septum formation initiator family protein [SAR324 cluster bacterium]
MMSQLLKNLRRPSTLPNSKQKRGKQTHNAKERVLYIWGLFSPPKPSAVQAKQADTEIRPISMMGLLIGFLLIMTLVGVVGDYGVLATSRLNDQDFRLRHEMQEMRVQEQELLAEVQALRTSSEYIDFLARRDLGLVKLDELIYYLPKHISLPRESSYLVFPSSKHPRRQVERVLEALHPLENRPDTLLSTSNTNSPLNGKASQ